MKKDCFFYLKIMSETALTLCTMLCEKDDFDTQNLIRISEDARNDCILFAVKQFLPPIDREDIAQIALLLHRLNKELYELAEFKHTYFRSAALTEETKEIYSVCKKTDSFLKDGLPKDINALTDKTKIIPENNIFQNRFNHYETIIRQRLFDKIRHCRDTADDLSDYITRTVIKNS